MPDLDILDTPGCVGDFACPNCAWPHIVSGELPGVGRYKCICRQCGRPFVLVVFMRPHYYTDERLELLEEHEHQS